MEVREQLVVHAVGQLRQATAEADRRAIVAHLQEQLQASTTTVYRHLRAAGWVSGRKTRADKGQSKLINSDHVRDIAALVAKGRDLKGRPNMPVGHAVRVAQMTGVLPDCHPSTVLRHLNEMGLGPRQMLAPVAGTTRVSLHPNQVWQVDVSPCLQVYWKDADGKKLEMYTDGQARFYPGKSHNFPKRRILRYKAVDHYSGAWFAAYYYAEGENAADMVDFLWRAMAAKKRAGFPFRGIPLILVADQGPAFKSAMVQNLLEALNITLELHASGNSKASGSVESRHYKWQRTFENLLPHDNMPDLPVLNRAALDSTALWSGTNKHTRHGRPPLEIWMRITTEQLRETPDHDTFFGFAATNPRVGTLTNRLWLRADGRTWQVRGENVYPGQKILFRLSLFLPEGLRAWTESGKEVAVAEVQFNDVGFPISGAHFHVWGEDSEKKGSTVPPTAGQDLAARMAEGTVATPDLGRVFDTIRQEADRQHYLDAVGTPWSGSQTAMSAPLLMTRLLALERCAEQLGRWLSDDESAWLSEHIGDGCTEADLDTLLGQLVQESTPLRLAQEG